MSITPIDNKPAEPVTEAANPEKPLQPPASRQMRLLPWLTTLVIIAFVLAIVLPPQKVEEGSTGGSRSKWARTKNDIRSIATALEAYYVDNDAYPPCAKGDLGMNAFLLKKDAPERNIWTFRAPRVDKMGRLDAASLTTPVAYMSSMPTDPFANYKGCEFGYYNADNLGWIIWSPGPDGVYDVDPLKDYDPYQSNPLPQLFLDSYDPTNGTISRGDVWRVKG